MRTLHARVQWRQFARNNHWTVVHIARSRSVTFCGRRFDPEVAAFDSDGRGSLCRGSLCRRCEKIAGEAAR